MLNFHSFIHSAHSLHPAMDRFSGRDNDLQEDVPKNRMSTFVSSGAALQQPPTFGKIEIQASRREQRKKLQAKAMPPASLTAQQARPSIPAPVWVGQPPKGSSLHVYKDDTVIDSIPLTQPMTVFGRGQASDVVLEHQSLSRQHAAVCYQRMTGKWLVMDLGSVHGTTYEGKAVNKNQPVELQEKGQLRFGGSSRVYVLSHSRPGSGEAATSAVDETAERNVDSQRPAATAQVGPQMDDAPGRFAHVVEEATFVGSEGSTGGRKPRKSPGSPFRRQAALQPPKRGLYDHLPPPEKAKS